MIEIPEYVMWQSQRDPKKIETQLLLRSPKMRKIVSRVGGILSLYFLDGSSSGKRQAMKDTINEYIETFNNEITHYKIGNSRSYKPIDYNFLDGHLRTLVGKEKNEDFYCSVFGFNPKEDEDPSLYRMIAFGFNENNECRRLSGIKFHFPPMFILDDLDNFVEMARCWSERLAVVHGSGGLGVLTEPGREMVGKVYYYPLMQKYPALEYDAMGDYCSETRHGGYELPRSSNWLTFLGDANIALLGGEDAVRAQLTSEMSLLRYSGGCVIRAGERPIIDSNGIGGIPEVYKDVARIIKPIRFEGYEYGIIEVPEERDSLEETMKWIRRFD